MIIINTIAQRINDESALIYGPDLTPHYLAVKIPFLVSRRFRAFFDNKSILDTRITKFQKQGHQDRPVKPISLGGDT